MIRIGVISVAFVCAMTAGTAALAQARGEHTIVVPDSVPVVTTEPGNRSSLAPGAHVIVYSAPDADGKLTATRISVGRNGSVPPI